MELCAIELSSLHRNILVISLYRPPNTNELVFLENYKRLLSLLKKESGKQIIMCMDHNFDLLKSTLHSKTRSGKKIIMCMDHNFDLLKSTLHSKTREFFNTNVD